jgi:glucose-1-phosphate thymidylyltransferase
MSFSFAVQDEPRGLADAYRIGREFLAGAPSVLVLGDNIFFGNGLQAILERASKRESATIFASHVRNPSEFGVVELGENNQALSLVEKPAEPRSNWAVTGLYFLDGNACDYADAVQPSPRGELEIISVLKQYLDQRRLTVETLHRGYAWLDAGTHESLSQAGEFVKTLQDRQGLLIASPEELAYRNGLIDLDALDGLARDQLQSSYGQALANLVAQERSL